MALVLPDGYGIATVTWQVAGAGSPGMNVFGYDNNGATADANAERWRDYFESLLVHMANAVFLESVKVVQRTGVAYNVWEVGPVGDGQGEVDTPTVPSNTTWLLKKRSGSMGRANTGRLYLPGVPEASVNASGELDAPTRAAFSLLIESGYAAQSVNGPMVLLHRNPLVPDDYTASPPTEVTNIVLDGRVATQRRRMR